MNDSRKIHYLYLFSAIWVILLTAIPTLLYKALPLDSVEVTAWANPFELGNAKHPPLGAWLGGIFDRMFFHTDFALYFLSQVLILAGFYYLYKLGREFFGVTKSIIPILLLAFISYYSFGSSTYNVNSPQMLFWPMGVYYFVRAYRGEKMLDWILFGISVGLITLSKYFGLLLPFSLFFFVLTSKETRKLFVKPGPYVAVLFCLLVLLPHIVWLFQNDYLTIKYVAGRAEEANDPVYWYSWIIIAGISLVLVAAPMLALWLSLDHPLKAIGRIRFKRLEPRQPEAFRLTLFLTFVPICLLAGLSMLGATVDVKWSFPIFITAGMFLLSLWKDDITDREFKKIFYISLAIFFLFQVMDVYFYLVKTNRRLHMDMKEVAQQAHEYYTETTGEDRIPIVYGDLWYSTSIGHYLPYHPHAGSLEDAYDSIRFAEEIRKHGGLAAMNTLEDLEDISKDFAVDPDKIKTINVSYKALFGKKKERVYYLTVIPPVAQ